MCGKCLAPFETLILPCILCDSVFDLVESWFSICSLIEHRLVTLSATFPLCYLLLLSSCVVFM